MESTTEMDDEDVEIRLKWNQRYVDDQLQLMEDDPWIWQPFKTTNEDVTLIRYIMASKRVRRFKNP